MSVYSLIPASRASEDMPALSAPHPVERKIWRRFEPWWPATVASVIFLALVAIFVRRSLLVNEGHFVYPLDDPYGHMAIARNLAQHGIWGFNAINGFSSGGSSLIWPLLLAGCFKLFGVHAWAPLALNVVAAVAFFFYSGSLIRRHTRSGLASVLILLAIMYLSPLPTMACTGMEHCWQILICLVFLDLAAKSLSDDEPPGSAAKARAWLPVLAFFMTMVRYEGLFLLGILGLLLLYRRQWRVAILCGITGGLPVLVFGLYACSKGWHFLPNSLLLKSGAPPLQSWDGFVAFITKGYYATLYNPHMFILVLGLVVALLIQWRRHESFWNRSTLLLSMLLGGTVLHLQFAGVGWFYRYESYLLGLGVLLVSLVLVDEGIIALKVARTPVEKGRRLVLLVLAGGLFCLPLLPRAANAWSELPVASHNIYEQQYQLAHFLQQSYPDLGVAANDIGVISFFTNINLLDLWGLGTMEVTEAKLSHTYTLDLVRRLQVKHDVRVIMVYSEWAFEYGGPLPEWVPVGQWTLPDNLVCGSQTVCFFAPNATMVPKLVEALRAYMPRLPSGVVQSGLYCGQPLPHIQGTYPGEKDEGGLYYWTPQGAQFFLTPSTERKNFMRVHSMLHLSTLTLSKGVTLDLTFNGRVIASRYVEPGEVGKWVDWPIDVRWREGENFVYIAARGGKLVSGDDGRRLLFAVREPTWTFPDRPEDAAVNTTSER